MAKVFRALCVVLAPFLLLAPVAEVGAQIRGNPIADVLSRSTQFRYNRVEGAYLGFHLETVPARWQGLKLVAETGYGLHNTSPRWEAGAEYERDKWSLDLTLFDRTDSHDKEVFSAAETTLFSLLFKWDYRDYFRAKNGFETKGSYRPRRHLSFVGGLSAFTYAPMPVETQWSLLYQERAFRENPQVRPGAAGLLWFGAVLDTRARGPLFRNAWHVKGIYERGFREFGYDGLLVSARRYQKVVLGSQAFVVQAQLKTRESTAVQHLFGLGGVSTLRGYGFKEFTGNRMLIASVDYLFRGDLLGRMPLKGFHLLSLSLFLDAGWVGSASRDRNLLAGFDDLHLGDFKADAGVALSLPQQLLRFNVARRLDRSDDAWVLSLRIRREL